MATKVKIDGVEYEVPEKFTVGELRKMEQKLGSIADDRELGSVLAVLWIARLRVDPTARFEAFDDLEPEQLKALVEQVVDVEADASPPAEAPQSV